MSVQLSDMPRYCLTDHNSGDTGFVRFLVRALRFSGEAGGGLCALLLGGHVNPDRHQSFPAHPCSVLPCTTCQDLVILMSMSALP